MAALDTANNRKAKTNRDSALGPITVAGPKSTHKTYCRICHASCAMEIDLVDGRPVALRGDTTDPLYGGYTCIRGRQLIAQQTHPQRVTKPLKRMPDGSFTQIPLGQALDEIAEKVSAHIKTNGPRSIATYCGTFAFQAAAAAYVAQGFHKAIGSPSYYSLVTIDQPSKGVAMTRFGIWAGGYRGFEESDVAMFIGHNPVVSHGGAPGSVPMHSPSRKYDDFIKRGGTVIVVDPRRTEMARKADYHLQVRPGQDPTLLAGMIKLILDEQRHDQAFCDQYFDNLEQLKAAIDDFDADYVAARTGVDAGLFVEATRAFAKGKVGIACAGTGPDMSPHGNLTEHLVLVLNTVLARYAKVGEPSRYPKILSPAMPRKAQVIPPNPAFGNGPRSRVRGLGQVLGEMPTSALPDEILEPGDGQVNVLFSLGGNPVTAWPDQELTMKALNALDLLVSIDVRMSETCQISDYVLPGATCLEREDVTALQDKLSVFEHPYAHYTKALCEPGDDVIDDWAFYWEIAKRIGADIELNGGKLPMDAKPSSLSVFELIFPNSRVPLAELRDHDGGKLCSDITLTVEPSEGGAKFQATPEGVVDEIRAIRSEPMTDDWRRDDDKDYQFLLISRRLKDAHNSNGREFDAIRAKIATNYAYMNPDDIAQLGVVSGDIVQIQGKHGQIEGVIAEAKDIRPGVVSMAHGWGALPGTERNVREVGSATTLLQAADQEFDPIHGMPRQSSIPVNVKPLVKTVQVG